MRKKLFGIAAVLLSICCLTGSKTVWAGVETVQSQDIIADAEEYANENYMGMVQTAVEGMQEEMGISISDMSNISMGEPYYIYDVRKELQSARFYFPIYDENQIILMLHVNYTSEGWKVTMDTEYTDVLSELDYKNTQCIFIT